MALQLLGLLAMVFWEGKSLREEVSAHQVSVDSKYTTEVLIIKTVKLYVGY